MKNYGISLRQSTTNKPKKQIQEAHSQHPSPPGGHPLNQNFPLLPTGLQYQQMPANSEQRDNTSNKQTSYSLSKYLNMLSVKTGNEARHSPTM